MTEAIRGQWRDVMKAWTQAIKTSRDWQFSLQVLRSLNKKRIQKDTWDVRCYSYHWRLGRFDVLVQQQWSWVCFCSCFFSPWDSVCIF